MIKSIVVDDVWPNLEEIQDLVNATGFIQVEKTYENPLEALAEIESSQAQVAFIDIDMPKMDGIELGERLLEINPALQIVFITAFNRYALQAFEINALDYILKPINTDRFKKMIEKIRKAVENKAPDSTADLKIKCFDLLEVRIGDTDVKWERSKAQELFAFLLMHHGEKLNRDTIIEQLWPDYLPQKATPILQTSISKIRQIFAPLKKGQVLLEYSAGGYYCLTIKGGECDYFEMEKALDGFREGDSVTYAALEKAAATFKKGFLAQNAYLWTLPKDDELKGRLQQALTYLTEVYASAGDNKGLIRALESLLSLMPYDEKNNNRLLEAYADTNNWVGITSHFQWLKKVLKEEYATAPFPSTEELFFKLISLKISNPAPK